MSHSHTDQEAHNAEAMAEIKKVTIILSVFTIVELILGFWMISLTSEALILAIKGTIVILMMAKAFYIVAYFMHLKHEAPAAKHETIGTSHETAKPEVEPYY